MHHFLVSSTSHIKILPLQFPVRFLISDRIAYIRKEGLDTTKSLCGYQQRDDDGPSD